MENIYYKRYSKIINGKLVSRIHCDDYLYDSNGDITDVKSDDLPKGYVYGIYTNGTGYINTCGVKSLYYEPSDNYNFFDDDILYISYSSENASPDNFDVYVSGNEMITVLKGVYQNSEVNTYPIYKKMNRKLDLMRKEHPNKIDVSYKLHVQIYGFPENLRKRKDLAGNDRKMKYEYETEIMRKAEFAQRTKQYAEWHKNYGI